MASPSRDLCDRVVVARAPEWLGSLWGDVALRASQREWVGADPAESWTRLTGVKAMAAARGLPTHPLGMRGYAALACRVARLAAMLAPRPDALCLCLDTQGDPTIRAQVLDGLSRSRVDDVRFVLAIAHQEVEAWVVSGFTPSDAKERTALEAVTRAMGFDPCASPHRLTPDKTTDRADAKRCCATLLPDGCDAPRAASCWLDTPLDALLARAAQTGMPDYVADVERELLPALGAPRSP